VTRRWTLRLVACLAVGAVVLSGCSEKQEANETLPSTSATPTTPELQPLGPEDLPMPAEARTQDAAGAEAFVRYYIDLINRTSKMMDAGPLRDLSDGCEHCNRIALNIEEDVAAGHRYVGGEITITEIATPLLKETTAEMAVRVDQAALAVVDRSGTPINDLGSEAYPGLSGGTSLRWMPERESWVMTGLTLG
jgi:hypothetical protein